MSETDALRALSRALDDLAATQRRLLYATQLNGLVVGFLTVALILVL